jgi:hypothetical protein
MKLNGDNKKTHNNVLWFFNNHWISLYVLWFTMKGLSMFNATFAKTCGDIWGLALQLIFT